MQAVQAFRGKCYSGVKTECHNGAIQVIVNGLGDANHPQALFCQHISDG